MIGRVYVVGGVFGGVGAQVIEGLLALRDKLFDGREQQLGGRRAPLDRGAFRREGQAVHIWGILQTGAVGPGGALGPPRAPRRPKVDTAAPARAAVHRLQEETVRRAALGRTVKQEVLLVQEVLHLLSRGPLQLKDTIIDYGDGPQQKSKVSTIDKH